MDALMFDTRVLVSVTTGKMFVESWRLFDLLDFMTGCEVWPRDCDEVMKLVRAHLVGVYPELVASVDFWEAHTWVEDFCDRVGQSFAVEPLPAGTWECDHRMETVIAKGEYL